MSRRGFRDDAIYFDHTGDCRDARYHKGCPGRWRGRAGAEARSAAQCGDPGYAAAQHKLGRRLPGRGAGLPAARGRVRPDDGRPR